MPKSRISRLFCALLAAASVLSFAPARAASHLDELRACFASCTDLLYACSGDRLFCNETCLENYYPGSLATASPAAAQSEAKLATPGSDAEPPTCTLRSASNRGVDVDVADSGGLIRVLPLEIENATVTVPYFDAPTADPVTVHAEKSDLARRARFALAVVDLCENAVVCDPVLTTTVRTTGKPAADVLTGVPASESELTVLNGDPGVRNLEVRVNGDLVARLHLGDGESRRLDLASAMTAGEPNEIRLTSRGRPGGSATVLVAEPGASGS